MSEVTINSATGSEGARIKLDAPAYTITVVAKKEGYDDSDAATATIQWGDGRPVFTGFTSVAIDTKGYSDVNGDGQVDVARHRHRHQRDGSAGKETNRVGKKEPAP